MTFELRESGLRDVTAGERVIIYSPQNIYEAVLGDDVFIGPFCEIQGELAIGSRTRVKSHIFICEFAREHRVECEYSADHYLR